MLSKDDIVEQVQMIKDTSESIVIANEEDLQNATLFIKDVKEKQKVVKNFYEPMVKATKESYDKIRMERDKLLKPLEEIEKEMRGLMNEYNTKVMQLKKAEEERIQKEKEEQERKIREAQKDLENGNIEEGKAKIQEYMENTTLPEKKIETPKVIGMATRTTYKVNITDITKVPTTYNNIPIVEISTIGKKYLVEQYKIAKATKTEFSVPGIEITEEATTIIR